MNGELFALQDKASKFHVFICVGSMHACNKRQRQTLEWGLWENEWRQADGNTRGLGSISKTLANISQKHTYFRRTFVNVRLTWTRPRGCLNNDLHKEKTKQGCQKMVKAFCQPFMWQTYSLIYEFVFRKLTQRPCLSAAEATWTCVCSWYWQLEVTIKVQL